MNKILSSIIDRLKALFTFKWLVSDEFKNLVTVLSILIAGLWFLQQKLFVRKINVTHSIEHRLLDSKYVLVHAAINVENVGLLPIDIKSKRVTLNRVLPLEDDFQKDLDNGYSLVNEGEQMIDWRYIGEPQINNTSLILNPAENDQSYYDFVIPCFLKTVAIVSNLSQNKDDLLYWRKLTYYDIDLKDTEKCEWPASE